MNPQLQEIKKIMSRMNIKKTKKQKTTDTSRSKF